MASFKFTGPLTITEFGVDEFCWRLERELVYQDDLGAPGTSITVPAGFITDGASIPRPLWWLLPTWGRYSRAAVIHDYLCTLVRRGKAHPQAPTRKAADAVFYDALVVCGVSRLVRWAMWIGVRIGDLLDIGGRNDRFN
jgi:hypothetical protein